MTAAVGIMGCVHASSVAPGDALAELQAAISLAAKATPLPPEGEFAETWDGGQTFHWSGRRKDRNEQMIKIGAGSHRHKAEGRVMSRIMAVDKKEEESHDRPKCAASYRGVRVGWLKKFAESVPSEWTTAEVVERKIKPETAQTRCRYIHRLAHGDIGEAKLFCSHTWGAPFKDLVAAIAHVASDDLFAWVE